MLAVTSESQMATTPEQRRKNLRLALILASVALAFALGLLAKLTLFGA
ncbi:MAG: hypothetical protein H0W40_05325 [Methylibium sp.]|nr:hypothetical protein [Methylibium sp.]